MLFKTTQYDMIFYGKVGCGGNAKQKALLKKHNINYEDRDILNTQWSQEVLEAFFDGLTNAEIINTSAPQIKRGEVDLSMPKAKLIEKMLQTPILIRRPLLEIGKTKVCGFDIEQINTLLSKEIENVEDMEKCRMKSRE